jgi:uracil-DNA glycosylase family 4
VLGEAPGRSESRATEPFIGPSGQLARLWLSEANLDPLSVLWANALCCWPARVDLKPTEDELRACRPHLEATLSYARPRFILALGGVALASLVPGAVVSVDRGKMYRARGFWGEAWVMGTFHPAWCLRNPGLAYIARGDVAWFAFWSLGEFEPWEGARAKYS